MLDYLKENVGRFIYSRVKFTFIRLLVGVILLFSAADMLSLPLIEVHTGLEIKVIN